MATAKSTALKDSKYAQGGGKKGVTNPQSGLAGSLEQVQLLTWKDFNKSMEMGVTVLSAQNPMASELLMNPVVNDAVMIVEGQRTVQRTTKNIQRCCAREIQSLNEEKRIRSVVPTGENESDEEYHSTVSSNESMNDDTVEIIEPMSDEEFNLRKQFIIRNYDEEMKILKRQLVDDDNNRQELIRYWHQSVVQSKNYSLFTRYNSKYGNPAGSNNVILYVKRLKELLYNLENTSTFDIEQQLQHIAEKWKSYNVYKVDMIPEEIKKLEEYNSDCEDLGIPHMKISDDNAVKFLMTKLKGPLAEIGIESLKRLKERDASIASATSLEQKVMVMQLYVSLPTKPENVYDYIQPLAPKLTGKFNHDNNGKKNTMYMSFFTKMKRNFKSKHVIGDEKKWCTICKAHGHLNSEWKCPKSEKDIPKSHKKEFMAFCNDVTNA